MARYSNQHRQPGELTAPEAGEMLGVTRDTVCLWCQEALSDGDSVLPKSAIRKDWCGRYWIQQVAIESLKARRGDAEY